VFIQNKIVLFLKALQKPKVSVERVAIRLRTLICSVQISVLASSYTDWFLSLQVTDKNVLQIRPLLLPSAFCPGHRSTHHSYTYKLKKWKRR